MSQDEQKKREEWPKVIDPFANPEETLDEVDLSRDLDSDPLWDFTGWTWDGEAMVPPEESKENVDKAGSSKRQAMTQAQFRARNRSPDEQVESLSLEDIAAMRDDGSDIVPTNMKRFSSLDEDPPRLAPKDKETIDNGTDGGTPTDAGPLLDVCGGPDEPDPEFADNSDEPDFSDFSDLTRDPTPPNTTP